MSVDDQRQLLNRIAMRRVRNKKQVRERLLLDPHARPVELDEQVVARRGGIIDRDEAGDPGALLGLDRFAVGDRKATVGRDIHVPRLDQSVDAMHEATQDQDARAVEIAGVPDRDATSAAEPEQQYDGPARLPAREHDELALGIGALDVVEEGRLVLEHRDALDRELDERGIPELRERERRGIPERGVTSDVIERSGAGASVDQRPEGVHEDRGIVAIQAADLERGSDRRGGRRRMRRRDVSLRRGIVGQERRREASGALATGTEGLTVSQNARGEVGDPDRGAKLEDRIERGGDIRDDRCRTGDVARFGESPGVPGAGMRGSELVGEERTGDLVGMRGQRSQLSTQGVLAGEGLGARIAGSAAERGVQEGVECEVGASDRTSELEPRAARRHPRDPAGGKDGAQGGERFGVGIDCEGPRQLAGPLEVVEDRVERRTGSGRHGDGGANGGGELHDPDDIAGARNLIAAEPGARAAAFAEGFAPLLARGLGGRVAAVLTAERTPWYLTVLYSLLLFRRDHELEPLHEDVLGRVLGPMERLGVYDGVLFAQDVNQLVNWGAIDRITEAHKLRSYRDNRRERFRYRLTDDAVALLEWLEARLAARLDGRVGDSRDRLADVLGHLREARRVLDAWRDGSRDADPARRTLYLLEAIGDAIDDVGTELLTFRSEMLAFASRPYELDSLKAILAWLERYVGLYVRRIEELRADIEQRFRELSAPRYQVALDECRAIVADERAAAPRALRGAALAVPSDRAAAHAAFFAPDGVLPGLCARIDASARAVVLKMQRHLRELERRNARLGDLRAAIRVIAAGPPLDPRLGELGTALVAAAHGRFDRREASAEHRAAPPVPRGHVRTVPKGTGRPLIRKQGGIEAVRELAARRRAALGAWLGEVVLGGGEDRVQLSTRGLAGADAPRRWLDVARAWHLRGGKELAAVGVALVAVDLDLGGEAIVGDESVGLAAPDCWIERRT